MHRSTPRRPRRLAGALTLIVGACAGGSNTGQASVVEIAAQPCDRPTRSFGFGVVVADDLVATAAHTVDGDLRTLTVDGAPATVLVSDPRTDLALLRSELDAPPAELSPSAVDSASVLDHPVRVTKTGTLIVHDATDRARYERAVHTFSPGVEEGTSGAPLIDTEGRVVGIVVLDNRGDDVAYAVTAAELAALMATEQPPTTRPPACGD
jgi:S1-C subfamily serine protease